MSTGTITTTADLAHALEAAVAPLTPPQAVMLVDEQVYNLHEDRIILPHVPILRVRAEEEDKTLAQAEQLWGQLYDLGIGRDAMAIVVGGGLTTDLGAFVCAGWKRGLRFMLVPSTLLGMVDAAIGGKTGVNFRGTKNVIGAFAAPEQVLIAPELLTTLPERQLRAGMAEIVKHALVADATLWHQLFENSYYAEAVWRELIPRAGAIKQRIVAADPYERGERKLLNFGHTLGHALESLSHHSSGAPLLHGEAVALGMALEAALSAEYAGLAEAERNKIQAGLRQLGLAYRLPPYDEALLRQYLRQDKKNVEGALRFTLLRRIGEGVIDQPVEEDRVLATLRAYAA
jgi:3-dehydroquinate synthase